MSEPNNRELGIDRPIGRRDFLSGAAIALSGRLGHPWFEASGQTTKPVPAEYPRRN
jgi:hypothetical protein